MKKFNIRHDGRLFLILASFPLDLCHAGQLFASAFMTQAKADEINAKFPGSVFPD